MMAPRVKVKKTPKFSISFSAKIAVAILVLIISFFVAKFYFHNESSIDEIATSEQSQEADNSVEENTHEKTKRVLRLWTVCVRKWNPKGSLRTIRRVFKKLGYKFVNASNGADWDVLWSIEYPFESTIRMRTKLFDPMINHTLGINQKINHFPGIQSITNKRILGLNTKSKYLFPTFVFPENAKEFEEYSAAHPNAKYVEKNYSNRGVRVVTLDEFNYDNIEKIYQVFLDNPFLINNRAFDFGVYVLITSVNPLRIYRYNHDVFIRFCPEEYLPFDRLNTRKYVVEESHMGVYEISPFKEIYDDYGYPFKLIFEDIIRKRGFNVDKFWLQIDDAITSIILQNEHRILKKIKDDGFDTTFQFFELVRFDIILDENLNPHVMEVNMSPNLTPTVDKFEENALIYEQLVYNTAKIVSVSNFDDFKSRFIDETIGSNYKNIATNLDECVSNNCGDEETDNCDNPLCSICLPCINGQTQLNMYESYREHIRRGNFQRIFPSSNHYDDTKLFNLLNENNKIMLKWFKAQCEIDKNWC